VFPIIAAITGATAISSGFIDGSDQIWLDNVQCIGTETRLIDCHAGLLGDHNCRHSDDAGVRCQQLGKQMHYNDIAF
jgi:hypothetical protein